MEMGYIKFDGKPIYLTMRCQKGWEFCGIGDSPSLVSREWFDKYITGEGAEFVSVRWQR